MCRRALLAMSKSPLIESPIFTGSPAAETLIAVRNAAGISLVSKVTTWRTAGGHDMMLSNADTDEETVREVMPDKELVRVRCLFVCVMVLTNERETRESEPESVPIVSPREPDMLELRDSLTECVSVTVCDSKNFDGVFCFVRGRKDLLLDVVLCGCEPLVMLPDSISVAE